IKTHCNASSLKNPSVFFSLQITPYYNVPIKDINIDTQVNLSYTYPVNKRALINYYVCEVFSVILCSCTCQEM
ncbi:hypothetical protein KA005_51805, partial [bacterium]|nr:hypothetical protein [bacterium]